jgi:apolipoprotein N-acyltransferase
MNMDGGKPLLYAALLFPVFGLVAMALGGRKSRKPRLRLAMVVVGAMALLSFAGCGGAHRITTPAGNYQLTVTAAATTVQATTTVTLTVK